MLQLNYRDSRPIYGQIKDGLRRLIVTGALEPDEKLPSVRAMAMDLAINPNTIQRAYAELEEELLEKLRELISELRCLRFTDAEILSAVEEGLKQ